MPCRCSTLIRRLNELEEGGDLEVCSNIIEGSGSHGGKEGGKPVRGAPELPAVQLFPAHILRHVSSYFLTFHCMIRPGSCCRRCLLLMQHSYEYVLSEESWKFWWMWNVAHIVCWWGRHWPGPTKVVGCALSAFFLVSESHWVLLQDPYSTLTCKQSCGVENIVREYCGSEHGNVLRQGVGDVGMGWRHEWVYMCVWNVPQSLAPCVSYPMKASFAVRDTRPRCKWSDHCQTRTTLCLSVLLLGSGRGADNFMIVALKDTHNKSFGETLCMRCGNVYLFPGLWLLFRAQEYAVTHTSHEYSFLHFYTW